MLKQEGTRSARGARQPVPRTRLGRPWRRTVALGLLLPQLAACYTYVPVSETVLPPGSAVTMGVTDRGRLALSESVGPGVRWIGGNVLSSTDTSLVLAVTSVQHIDLGIPVRWAGEQVTVSREFVTDVREKRLSRSRTVLLAAAIVVGAVTVSTLAINGFGSDPDDTKPDGGDPPQSVRVPLFIIR